MDARVLYRVQCYDQERVGQYMYICTFVHLYICTFVHFYICTFVHLYIVLHAL